MRTAVAAFTAFYNLHLGRDWKLFRLVRSPSPQTLPTVLTRDEVNRLFRVIREDRFRVILRLIYACGLRVSEAINLEVTQIKRDGPRLHLQKTKFSKELARRVRSPNSHSSGFISARDYFAGGGTDVGVSSGALLALLPLFDFFTITIGFFFITLDLG